MTTTRAAIGRLLAHADDAMSADAVAASVGVHLTTARFHLDRLVADGDAVRTRMRTDGPGRPSLGYERSPSARADPARIMMITALARALSAASDGPELAVAAGREWADGLDGGLHDVLRGAGFAPEAEGDGIRLRSCPFAGAASEHPEIICAAHRGLVERIAARRSESAELIPFDENGGCFVRRTPLAS